MAWKTGTATWEVTLPGNFQLDENFYLDTGLYTSPLTWDSDVLTHAPFLGGKSLRDLDQMGTYTFPTGMLGSVSTAVETSGIINAAMPAGDAQRYCKISLGFNETESAETGSGFAALVDPNPTGRFSPAGEYQFPIDQVEYVLRKQSSASVCANWKVSLRLTLKVNYYDELAGVASVTKVASVSLGAKPLFHLGRKAKS